MTTQPKVKKAKKIPDAFYTAHPIIDSFAQYMVEQKRATSLNSVHDYRHRPATFLMFAEAQFAGFKLSQVKVQHYHEWKRHLVAMGYAHASIVQFTAIVKVFLGWLHHTGQCEEQMTYKRDFVRQHHEKRLYNLLTPAQIFLLRKQRGVSLEGAAFQELALCTGMRLNELLQIRCRDIRWDRIPTDQELKAPSPYVVATIPVYRNNIRTKRNRMRVAYVSRIAGKLVTQIMERYRLERDSDQPLFPFNADTIGPRIMKIHARCFPKVEAPVEVVRSPVHLDVNPSAFADPVYQAKVRELQKYRQRQQDATPNYAKGLNMLSEKQGNFRPWSIHGWRHLHSCIMYYRNFHGERQNEFRVSTEMGHKALESTKTYLTHFNFIQSDSTWKTLWTGTNSDWRMFSD